MIVVCSSYNGTPPDNAAAFCRWIAGADAGATDGVAYTVFGCGNTEWAATYQAVPTLLDDAARGPRRPPDPRPRRGQRRRRLRRGVPRLARRPLGRRRQALDLPAEVAGAAPTGPRLSITLTNRQVTNPVIMSYEARPATVRANRELIAGSNGKPPDRSTRHLEIALPATSRNGRATTSACSRATAST